ncbi:unnamed protein product [Mytilus edulis]|uniref:Integrase zinc-binding domain-containing protein n=1 Tax=Mytilus edulis TaxID=6550 RepID=A0A8S3R4S7_MYTED|nr:unnamed protein product [Mytilus edulis]
MPEIFVSEQEIYHMQGSLPLLSDKGSVPGPSALHGTTSDMVTQHPFKGIEGASTAYKPQHFTTPATATFAPSYVGTPYVSQGINVNTPLHVPPATSSESYAASLVQSRPALYPHIGSMIQQPPPAFMTPVMTTVASTVVAENDKDMSTDQEPTALAGDCHSDPSPNLDDTLPYADGNPCSNWAPEYPPEQLKIFQQEDPELAPILKWMEEDVEPTQAELRLQSRATRSLWLCRPCFVMFNHVLYYKFIGCPARQGLCLVVPSELKGEVLKNCHDTKTSGHLGQKKTLDKLKQAFLWYNMRKDCDDYVSTCATCSQNKKAHVQPRAPLGQFHAGYPMERVHLDILGPFNTSNSGNNYVLMMVDQFTKWRDYPTCSSSPRHATVRSEQNDPNVWVKHLVGRMQKIHEFARHSLHTSQLRQKRDYDLRVVEHKYQPGDLVYKADSTTKVGQSRKLKSPWCGPFLVVSSRPPLYTIRGRKGDSVVHHDKLKLCNDRDIPTWIKRLRHALFQAESEMDESWDDLDDTIPYGVDFNVQGMFDANQPTF